MVHKLTTCTGQHCLSFLVNRVQSCLGSPHPNWSNCASKAQLVLHMCQFHLQILSHFLQGHLRCGGWEVCRLWWELWLQWAPLGRASCLLNGTRWPKLPLASWLAQYCSVISCRFFWKNFRTCIATFGRGGQKGVSYKIIQDHTDLTSTENLESTKEVHRKDTGRTSDSAVLCLGQGQRLTRRCGCAHVASLPHDLTWSQLQNHRIKGFCHI
jgi:hypothetical protein